MEEIREPFEIRKFSVCIAERHKFGKTGPSLTKTIDFDDVKPIFELLKKAEEYNKKHGIGKLIIY